MNELPQTTDNGIEELVSQLADEYLNRLAIGEDPSIEDYAKKHPDAADVIRRTLGALRTMRLLDHDDAIWSGKEESHEPPKEIGDFRLIRIAGRGGMGIVYEAEQVSLGRRVALKVLPYAAMLDARALQRFQNEVTAAAQLDHPNIVPVYGVGCDRGVHHYAMRFIEGVTVSDIINQLRDLRDREQQFPDSFALMSAGASADGLASQVSVRSTVIDAQASVDTVVDEPPMVSNRSGSWKNVRLSSEHFRSIARLAATVAESLDHAHEHGVIHRDIKPSNLMVDGSGKPWVTDFGLAQVETGTALTMTGDLLGTARYMSPEQLMAKRLVLDHRTDIYSLGVTLYQLLTLELPFDSESRQELYRQILMDEPRRPKKINPSIPSDLETIVLKAIDKNPVQRYQTAQKMADDLHRFLRQEPIRARKASLAIKSRRWVQRNAAFVSGAMSVLTCSLVVMAFALAFLISERGAKQSALYAAEQEKTRATENFNFALGILKDFLIGFADADLAKVPGAERQRQSILRRAAGRFDEMVARNPDSDELIRGYADVLFKLGNASLEIDNALAADCFVRCINLGQEQLANGLSPEEQQKINRQIAYAGGGRAKANAGSRPQIADQYFREVIDTLRARANAADQQPDASSDLANVLFDYAVFLANNGRKEEAITHFEDVLKVGDDAKRSECFYQMSQIRLRQERLNDALQFAELALGNSQGINQTRRDFKAQQARVLFAQNNTELAKKAVGSSIHIARCSQGEIMTKQFADWLIPQLQLDAQLAGKLGKQNRQIDMLQQALALHMTYYYVMLEKAQLIIRRDIQLALAEAQDSVGQNVTADSRRTRVSELNHMIELVPPKQNGVTFPLGAIGDENLSCVATDNHGNVYVTGNLSSGIDLQPGYEFRGVNPSTHSVLCKYTPDGTVIWTCPLSGFACALAIDSQKNIFVKGMLRKDDGQNSIRVGDVDKKIPVGARYICYLAKTDPNGRVLWVQWAPSGSLKGLHFDHSIAVAPDSSVVIGGTFQSDFEFSVDPPIILRQRKIEGSELQGYVARYSADGVVQWARSVDAKNSHVGGVDFDRHGNVYLCGHAEPISDATLGIDTQGKPFRLADQEADSRRRGLLAKLNSEGQTVWVRKQVSENSISGWDVVVGVDGRIYNSTRMDGNLDLHERQDYEDQRDQVKFDQSFWDSNLNCWDPDGQLLWNLPLNQQGYISAYSLARDSRGGVFVTGRSAGADVAFGEQRLFRHPGQGRDGFVASVSNNGKLNQIWFYTTYINHSSAIVPWAVAANDQGQIAVVGRTRGTARAPTGEILRQPFSGAWDGFITIISTAKK